MKQTVEIKDLTIELICEFVEAHSLMYLINPGGELFQGENGLLIDVQSLNLIKTIHDALKPSNQAKFNTLLQSEYKLASFLDDMWSMVQ